MTAVLIVLAVLIGAIALVAIIGVSLPKGHVASVETRVPVAPATLWKILTDVDNFPRWRPDVKRVERQPDDNGRPVWTEHTSTGPIRFAVDDMNAPRRLVTRIADADLPFGGTWTFEIAPDGSGSSLRITERGEVYNPLFRFVARFVFGHERTMRTYVEALQRRAAQQEAPHGV
jgi:uncharacterized protein YndB with AHSA1/START domain